MSTTSRVGRDATWPERCATFAVFLTLGIGVGAWAAAIPAIKANLALSDRALSIALLALAAGSILATLMTGVLAPRLGTGRATAAGALTAVVALALPPFAESLAGLVATTFAIGLFGGFLDVSVNGHAGYIEERWGAPIMSSFHGAFSLGGLVGAALGGGLAAAGAGPSGQLWVPVALATLLNLLALPFLGEGTAQSATADPERRGPAPRRARPSRTLLLLGTIAALSFVIEGAVADWSAVFLASVAGSSVAVASTSYAAFSIAMAAGRFAGDGIVARFGAERIMSGGGGLAAAGLALAVGWPDPLVAGLGFALVGIGLSNIVPVLFSAAARTGPNPAAGIAPVAAFGYAGFLSGPPVIGLVASLAGLKVGLGCLVPAALVVVLLGRIALGGQPRSEGLRSRI